MNLRYLYIKGRQGIFRKGIELCFDRSWRFRVDESFNSITCTKVCENDTGKFTTSLLLSKTPVENLTVIVGENGSGKTSIVELLSRLSITPDVEYAIVFSSHDICDSTKEYWYSYSMKKRNSVPSSCELHFEGVSEPPSIGDYGYSFNLHDLYTLVYLTPHFTTERPFAFSDDNFVDLSTLGLLDPEAAPIFEERLGMNGIVANVSREEFEFDERRRILEFAKVFNDATKGMEIKAPFKLPNFVSITPAVNTIDRLRKICEKKAAEKYDSNSAPANLERTQKLIEILSSAEHGSVLEKIYGLFVTMCYFTRNPHERSERIWNGVEQLVDKWKSGLSIDDIQETLTQAFPGNKKEKAFFLHLGELIKAQEDVAEDTQNQLTIDIREKCDEVLDLIDAHKSLALETPLFRVEFGPRISSGEMAYLTMFGRAYSILSHKELRSGHLIKKDFLFFLDEIETALHPRWQREIVWNWLWFFETFAKDKSVHLIFASHSPLLLSDVPASNVIFLERKSIADGREVEPMTVVCAPGRVIKKSLDVSDTFFANIQDLYALPFVLKNGVVGKRAEMLLREALNKKLKIKFAERKKVVEKIGDPIVRSVALETLRLGGYEGGER